MPADLFRSVGVRRTSAGRRLGAVPLSLAFHALLLGVVIVAPLLATDVLPAIPIRLVLDSGMPVAPVPPPPPPRQSQRPVVPQTRGPVTPLVPPSGIQPEIAHPTAPEIREIGPTDTDSIFAVAPPDVLAPPPPPPPPEPVRPVRMSEVRPPVKIHDRAPIYPTMAIAAHVEGTVTIEAIISTNGTIEQARVISSVPLLDEAALAAVRQWVYRPTLLNGVPVPVIMTVKVEFKLR